MNIFGKLNLATFKQSVKTTLKSDINGIEKGQEVLIIPIGVNKLFCSDKGGVYFDFIAFENKTPNELSTHMVKQSFSKEVRNAMSEEQRKAQPIFGNIKVGESQQTTQEYAAPVINIDDLPF